MAESEAVPLKKTTLLTKTPDIIKANGNYVTISFIGRRSPQKRALIRAYFTYVNGEPSLSAGEQLHIFSNTEDTIKNLDVNAPDLVGSGVYGTSTDEMSASTVLSTREKVQNALKTGSQQVQTYYGHLSESIRNVMAGPVAAYVCEIGDGFPVDHMLVLDIDAAGKVSDKEQGAASDATPENVLQRRKIKDDVASGYSLSSLLPKLTAQMILNTDREPSEEEKAAGAQSAAVSYVDTATKYATSAYEAAYSAYSSYWAKKQHESGHPLPEHNDQSEESAKDSTMSKDPMDTTEDTASEDKQVTTATENSITRELDTEDIAEFQVNIRKTAEIFAELSKEEGPRFEISVREKVRPEDLDNAALQRHVVAVWGKVSSGKSTLLKAIMGVDPKETDILAVGAMAGTTQHPEAYICDARWLDNTGHFLLMDLPGLHEAADVDHAETEVERLKREKAHDAALMKQLSDREVNLGIMVVNGSADTNQKVDFDILTRRCGANVFVVRTKSDDMDSLREKARQRMVTQWQKALTGSAGGCKVYTTTARGYDPDELDFGNVEVKGVDELKEDILVSLVVEEFIKPPVVKAAHYGFMGAGMLTMAAGGLGFMALAGSMMPVALAAGAVGVGTGAILSTVGATPYISNYLQKQNRANQTSTPRDKDSHVTEPSPSVPEDVSKNSEEATGVSETAKRDRDDSDSGDGGSGDRKRSTSGEDHDGVE